MEKTCRDSKSASSAIRQRGSKSFCIPEGGDKLGVTECEVNEILQAAGTTFGARQDATALYEWTQVQLDDGTVLEVGFKEAALEECPRCWLSNRVRGKDLCDRCASVVYDAGLEHTMHQSLNYR